MVDTVEQRHDRRSVQQRRRGPGQRGEQVGRLHRDEQDVDRRGQPRPGRDPDAQLAVPGAAQGQSVDVDRGARAVGRQQRHVVAGLGEQHAQHAADRARSQYCDPLRHNHSFAKGRHRSRPGRAAVRSSTPLDLPVVIRPVARKHLIGREDKNGRADYAWTHERVHGSAAGHTRDDNGLHPVRVRRGAFDATSFLRFRPLYGRRVAVVVNHLHLTDPISDETVQAFRDIVPRIVNGGASAAQVVQVDATHIVLILEFASAEDADRVASETAARGCASTSSRCLRAARSAAWRGHRLGNRDG